MHELSGFKLKTRVSGLGMQLDYLQMIAIALFLSSS